MKSLCVSILILSCLLISFALVAQTKSAKAPSRKKDITKKTTSPPTAQPVGKPATTVSSTPRANSEKLPEQANPTPQAVQARPAVGAHRSSTTSSRTRTYTGSSAGYGYEKGNNLLNIGVGLSSYYYGNPVGVSFEVGIDKDFSVGGQFDYNSGNYGDYYYNNSRWRYTSTYFGARGSYHANRLLRINSRKADLYAGLGLGYRSFRWNDANYGYGYDYSSGLFLNYFIGGKYYLSDKVGAFLELGYSGLSSSRIGLAVKF